MARTGPDHIYDTNFIELNKRFIDEFVNFWYNNVHNRLVWPTKHQINIICQDEFNNCFLS